MRKSGWFPILLAGYASSSPPPSAAANAEQTEGGVIAGRVEFAQAALRRLAARKQGDDTPDDWRPWLSEMQALTQRGSTAATMAETAAAVAAVSTKCGECHRATRGDVELRELGRVADNGRVPAQKHEVFAKISLRCGSGHAQIGVVLL